MREEVVAWELDRNNRAATINRRFTTEDARVKLKRLYPELKCYMILGQSWKFTAPQIVDRGGETFSYWWRCIDPNVKPLTVLSVIDKAGVNTPCQWSMREFIIRAWCSSTIRRGQRATRHWAGLRFSAADANYQVLAFKNS